MLTINFKPWHWYALAFLVPIVVVGLISLGAEMADRDRKQKIIDTVNSRVVIDGRRE